MVNDIFTLYPNVTIEPCRVSQDMLEGLFGTIRQLGGDSSTQTLKGYGHALNKFQITAKVTAEVKSLNYGTSSHTGMEFDYLSRCDYRRKSSKDKNVYPILLTHTELSKMSSFMQRVFKSLLLDDLFMGRINIPTLSFRTEADQQIQQILLLQIERQQLFNSLLYNNEIILLLEKWKKDIKNIALKSIPKRKGNLWMTTWISHLEANLNNYICSGVWFQQFQEVIVSQSSLSTQRLVAYFLIQKLLEETYKSEFNENKNIQEQADPTLIPKVIITLNRAEASKFSYIVGWILFKLLKRDHLMNSHPKFSVMRILLGALCIEKVEYTIETKLQTTNVIPGSEFLKFMYHLESLVIELFEKHSVLGPNILCYVKNSLLINLHLNQMFIEVLKSSNEKTNVELENEEMKFIYERCVSIYMKSRQKTWRDVNNYIPEKGTASLRENLKVMRSSNSTVTSENKKSTIIKKAYLPSDPANALEQLRAWAQLEEAEESFAKVFLVQELLWLVWAFGISTQYKRKQKLKANNAPTAVKF
uniref:Uncharacterized protein n=1 Tax=Rhizophagus irregularis (strain DAOM 181602 / DAOM 197198 / MUCL 43194) TaxID=747089 RepID=U9TUN1_RHIID